MSQQPARAESYVSHTTLPQIASQVVLNHQNECSCRQQKSTHKGLVVAAFMRVLWQQVMQELAEHCSQAASRSIAPAVICQHEAGLLDLLSGQPAVMACCYQGSGACACQRCRICRSSAGYLNLLKHRDFLLHQYISGQVRKGLSECAQESVCGTCDDIQLRQGLHNAQVIWEKQSASGEAEA